MEMAWRWPQVGDKVPLHRERGGGEGDENTPTRSMETWCLRRGQGGSRGRLGRGVTWTQTPRKHIFFLRGIKNGHPQNDTFGPPVAHPERVRAGLLNWVHICDTHRWWTYLMCVWDGPAFFGAAEFLQKILAFLVDGPRPPFPPPGPGSGSGSASSGRPGPPRATRYHSCGCPSRRRSHPDSLGPWGFPPDSGYPGDPEVR